MKTQLVNVFSERTVLTTEELKNILGTTSRMTIFRKLKQLPYKSSYTHCGKYYTLDTLAQYNKNGIWDYNQICFSKYGSLINSALKTGLNVKTVSQGRQELISKDVDITRVRKVGAGRPSLKKNENILKLIED